LKLATFSRSTSSSQGAQPLHVPRPALSAIHCQLFTISMRFRIWNLFDKTEPILLSINAFKS